MRAAFILRTGPPEVIQWGELPEPVPGPAQCLIRVQAVDVNPIDVYWRGGLVPAPMTFPFILGRDLAGVVAATGAEVTRFRTGDRVWCSNQGFEERPGTFSELAAVDETWLHPIPPEVRDEDMVAVSLTGLTAWLGLARARVEPGETLFVSGGSGGVGSCVVQMARALGARVITTAGSADKARMCRELGADVALNYRTDDVEAAIRDLAPGGVQVWWETVREPDFDRAVRLLGRRGRLVLMAGREARPAFPVGPFYVKDGTLHGFALFNASAAEQRPAAAALNAWLAEGRLRAHIDRVLPLAEVVAAHRLQEASTLGQGGNLAGKLVLRV